jgi:glycerate dehydrogenase
MSRQPKIVVLDGYTLNPGDLSWAGLEALGTCKVYDRTAESAILSRAESAEILLTNKTPLTRDTIQALHTLRYIGVLATGYNVVDARTAKEQNVVVTNVPTYGTESVAQLVFAHLLNLTNRVTEHACSVQSGEWTSNPDWCYWKFPLVELTGRTIGIVGLGRIGSCTAHIAHAFGMNVLAYNPRTKPVPDYVSAVEFLDVLHKSDVVSLHCPLNDATSRIVNENTIHEMQRTAFLINTSRGGLIDEHALASALNRDEIAGAGLDVLSTEPPVASNPLLQAKNCYVTPHIAWATFAARNRLLQIAVANVRSFLAGEPANVVNM